VVPGKRNAMVYFATILASKFVRLQRVEHTAREGVKTRIADLDDLKHRIRADWAKLYRAVVVATVRQRRRRLSACVVLGGGHFEHCF